jgi:hypothetical protein
MAVGARRCTEYGIVSRIEAPEERDRHLGVSLSAFLPGHLFGFLPGMWGTRWNHEFHITFMGATGESRCHELLAVGKHTHVDTKRRCWSSVCWLGVGSVVKRGISNTWCSDVTRHMQIGWAHWRSAFLIYVHRDWHSPIGNGKLTVIDTPRTQSSSRIVHLV